MTDAERASANRQIKFISNHDPLNPQAFSGTIFYMVKALQEVFPDIELAQSRPFWFERLRVWVDRLSRGTIDIQFWKIFNRSSARSLQRRWRGQRVIVIAAVDSFVSSELAASVPVIHVSDTTFELVRKLYPNVARLSERNAATGEAAEARCITRVAHSSFSSQWAASSAVGHYRAKAANVSAISWGCNLADVPAADVRLADADGSPCKLLFLGADWTRKGGDIVTEAASRLAEAGVPVQLDIAGSSPPGELASFPWVKYHGFLRKSDEAEFAKLRDLIREADFLFLPTRQDCTPMVFAEANAYGTPVITRDVGGVADVVIDGRNGIVLSADAAPGQFAETIAEIWNDRPAYARLRETSRREYEHRLNWRTWAQRIAEVVNRLEARMPS